MEFEFEDYSDISFEINNNKLLLVDISPVDIYRISITRQNKTWFALPTEIMNTQTICNIHIDQRVTNLFLQMPELSLLYSSQINSIVYPLPDAVYTGADFKKVEFCSVFGISKDSSKSHTNFISKYNFPFDLLSDADGKLFEAFGVWVEKSMYGRKYMGTDRKSFIIDENGVLIKIIEKVCSSKSFTWQGNVFCPMITMPSSIAT